jgi:branched-chain amino acid aminotransferase
MVDSSYQLWEQNDDQWFELTNYDWSLNRALKYGDGFFETIRVAYGIPQFWPNHLQRMNLAIQTLGFQPLSLNGWGNLYQLILQQIQTKCLQAGRLRLSAFRYAAGLYGPSSDNWVVNLLLSSSDNSQNDSSIDANQYQLLAPIRALVVKSPYLIGHPLGSFKSLNALPYVLAQRTASQQGFETCLIIDKNGYLIEAGYANVVLIKENICYLPKLDEYGIMGVMQPIVVDILANLGIPITSIHIHSSSFNQYGKIWLINTMIGIREIAQIKNTDNQINHFHANNRLAEEVMPLINKRLIQAL